MKKYDYILFTYINVFQINLYKDLYYQILSNLL